MFHKRCARRIEGSLPRTSRGAAVTLAALAWLGACVDSEKRGLDGEVASDVGGDVDGATPDAPVDTSIPEIEVANDGSETTADTSPPVDTAPTCEPACVNGTCVAQDRCECAGPWTGPDCAEASCTPECDNGGACVAPDTCDCGGTGFGGALCRQKTCGERLCPMLEGYLAACNGNGYCEYTRAEITEAWQADDVWIHIPPGTFPMGAPEAEPAGELERPVVDVTIEHGFLIGKFEVTTRLHEACEALIGGCTPPSANDFVANGWDVNRSAKVRHLHPQNGLTRAQAAKVCAFLGGRLPSSAEWELAAKGPAVHRQYPWGNSPAPICGEHAVFDAAGMGCGTGGTFVVGPTARTAGRAESGAFDMAGNVWEWVSDCWHDGYEGAPDDGRPWLEDCVMDAAGPLGVLRGGAFTATNVRAATRHGQAQAIRRADVGVRCARDVP